MRALRRALVTAVVTSLSILSLAAVDATAAQPSRPAAASARAAAPVPVDTPVHLVESATDRGVGYEVYAGWDYVLLANDSGNPGTRVVFHPQGDGYTIESTSGNWGGYTYWHVVGNGIRLDTRENATVFQVVAGGRGLLLKDAYGNYATYPIGGKGWLQMYASVLPNFRDFGYFRVQQ
ncbi:MULTISPECIES: hypothetical protein [Streptomyces]|uniref:Uncharacterized protein n=2 Tax=Streptomyces TaxID=1883 RepID=A0ABS9JFZ7_9ACTN|nr:MULTISPECIES: hypothetical protein [Streptomyces]MCG0064496.1 hypothetical protein [Streptomyces tricolor]OYP13583.1 hypothetical protein CFC35_03005 [Streptomyces sp. FBKL.4005]BCM65353.1 hypothetical protein EASAB2608_00687 [Streptomyces sp. EAS-AB2608]